MQGHRFLLSHTSWRQELTLSCNEHFCLRGGRKASMGKSSQKKRKKKKTGRNIVYVLPIKPLCLPASRHFVVRNASTFENKNQAKSDTHRV